MCLWVTGAVAEGDGGPAVKGKLGVTSIKTPTKQPAAHTLA
ncbi:hypothetical protein [Pelotomaculum terephthalicicum]|nr:hypothetical protein [Pelotomaculum terephthalicicum]